MTAFLLDMWMKCTGKKVFIYRRDLDRRREGGREEADRGRKEINIRQRRKEKREGDDGLVI